VQFTLSQSKQVGLFPCRGWVVPCRTLLLVSATCRGTVKPGFANLGLPTWVCQASRFGKRLKAQGKDDQLEKLDESACLPIADLGGNRFYRTSCDQQLYSFHHAPAFASASYTVFDSNLKLPKMTLLRKRGSDRWRLYSRSRRSTSRCFTTGHSAAMTEYRTESRAM
jgi:hypothetical protein